MATRQTIPLNATAWGHLMHPGVAPPQKGVPRANVPLVGGAPAPAPGAAGAAAGAGGAPLTPDAQYLAEAAQRAFDRQTQLNSYNEQSQQDRANTGTAIQRILDRIGADRSQIDSSANKQGLLYSSTRTQNESDYEKAVQQQQDDANRAFQQREDARAAARTALQQGAPLEEAAALAAAANRQITGDTGAADANALVANSAPAASPQVAALGRLVLATQQAHPGVHGQRRAGARR
jgi:hypothetical protein